MFSEALRILDNNTAELMADRFKAQLENAKIEVKAVKHELKTTRKEVTAARQLSLIHISEPTRRTPISYAVFCLKKKKITDKKKKK